MDPSNPNPVNPPQPVFQQPAEVPVPPAPVLPYPPVNAPLPAQPLPSPEQPASQMPTTAPPPTPLSPVIVGGGRSKKKILFIILILFILLGGGAGVALLSSRSGSGVAPTATPQATPIAQKDDELAGFSKGIVIGPNTVSVTKADGKFCLRYKDKIYLPQDLESELPKIATPPDPSVYTWYGLINAPEDLTNQDSELFSFKPSPDNQSFVFIMRWARSPEEQFEMFRFNSDGVVAIRSFGLPSIEGAYAIPRVSQMSMDGNYSSVNLYKCIDCAVHHPETLLVNLPQVQSRKIGKVQEFKWGESGTYTYKEAIPTTCLNQAETECFQSPSSLAIKQGSI